MICIIDYNAGNLTSVKRALDYLGIEGVITADGEQIRSADRIIFPGVGHAATAVETMRDRGLDTALRDAWSAGTPVLGICLGTQIILGHSQEGDTPCLGLLPGEVVRFTVEERGLKVPHMGWNRIAQKKEHFILKDLRPQDEVYFVHSYYPVPEDENAIIASTTYGETFPSVIGSGNLVATQFHPEKSGPLGLQILENFAQWDGTEC